LWVQLTLPADGCVSGSGFGLGFGPAWQSECAITDHRSCPATFDVLNFIVQFWASQRDKRRSSALLTGKGKYPVIDTASVSCFDWAIASQFKPSRRWALIEWSGQGGETLNLIEYGRSACELITSLRRSKLSAG